MYTPRLLCIVLACAVLDSAPSLAWPPDGVPISVVSGAQTYPVITLDGSGGAIVAWTDTRNGNSDIFAQRVNAAGAVQWATNGVAISIAAGGQYGPALIPDAAGGAFVIWSHNGNGLDVYVQRVNAAGVPQWTPGGVPVCIAEEDQLSPMIVADGAGGIIATWYDWRNGVDFDIYGQRINGSGVVQWATDGVALCTVEGEQYGPTIVSDQAGGAIVVWYDYRDGDADLYAQRIDASGAAQWTTNGLAFCSAANDQYGPLIVPDGAGGAIAAWLDWRNSGPSANSDVFAQRIDASGAPQWTPDGVALCTATGEQFYPIIAADGTGGACVTWWDRRGPHADIYAQRVNGAGAVQWTSNGVAVSSATGDQVYPKITSDGAGGAIVTWFDYRTGTGDIYAQNVSAAGAVQWAPNGLAVCTATNHQTYPTIASSGTGGAIVTWQDWRTSVLSDVYAQRVGTPPTNVGSTPPNARLSVLQNHPNPFSATTEFRVGLREDADVSIELYDVAGRRVRAQSLGSQSAGWKSIPFDGRDDAGRPLASGVYFYRVTANGTTVTQKMVIAR